MIKDIFLTALFVCKSPSSFSEKFHGPLLIHVVGLSGSFSQNYKWPGFVILDLWFWEPLLPLVEFQGFGSSAFQKCMEASLQEFKIWKILITFCCLNPVSSACSTEFEGMVYDVHVVKSVYRILFKRVLQPRDSLLLLKMCNCFYFYSLCKMCAFT